MEESTAKVAEPVTKVENTPVTPVTPKKKFPVWAIVLLVILALCLLSIGCFVLAGALVAVNPSKNISEARNTQRRSDVTEIYDAVNQAYSDDVNLSVIPTCKSTPKGKVIGSNTGLVNLAPILVPTYIASLPIDPLGGTTASTGYSICMDETLDGKLRVMAPNSENGIIVTAESQ